MELKRLYVDPAIELTHDFWLHDEALLKNLNDHFQAGQKVVLYNDVHHERLYNIVELKIDEAHLVMLTEFMPSEKN
ncbi:MAG TPA: hypothetical protein VLF39_00375 [Candidatus Saccharimonadales bacterium]|nr:hypothetical protein [Candidatus Saccharimonadales bacterium]